MKKTILFIAAASLITSCDKDNSQPATETADQCELTEPFYNNLYEDIYWGKGYTDDILTEMQSKTGYSDENGIRYKFGERQIAMRYEFEQTGMPVYSLYIAPRFLVSADGARLVMRRFSEGPLIFKEALFCISDDDPGIILQRREQNHPLLIGLHRIKETYTFTEDIHNAGLGTLVCESDADPDITTITVPENRSDKWRTVIWRFVYDTPYALRGTGSTETYTDMALDLTLVQLPGE